MAILVDDNTRLIVQGMTGREGTYHTQQMKLYGTKVVAGVTPVKAGPATRTPVFNTVREAVQATNGNTSVIFVPGPGGAEAVMEAADAGVSLIVCITELIPVHDMARAYRFVQDQGARLIGPNCPGLVSSGQAKVGIMGNSPSKKGMWAWYRGVAR
jgi:succinyl-CoA synthetase alpha subunit